MPGEEPWYGTGSLDSSQAFAYRSAMRCPGPTLAVTTILSLAACTDPAPSPTTGAAPAPPPAPTMPDPATLHRDLLVIDTHIDLPYRLEEKPADISKRLTDGHFDLVRAREGGLDASFWAIFVPSRFDQPGTWEEAKGGAFAEALRQIGAIEKITAANAAALSRVNSPDELERAVADGKHAVALGLENGAPIEGDLDKLRQLFAAGIRYVTPVHAHDNHICDSSYDERHTHKGLSAFGKRLIPEMNRLGVMIDVSHVSDDAFWQIVALSRAPLVATHSGLRHFRDMERNLSDEMLLAIEKNGGVVQLNFGTYFLSDAAATEMERVKAEIDAARKAAATPAEGERRAAEIEASFAAHNLTLADFVDQIDYAVKLVGVDHVGLGSDFDGVYFTPKGLEDVSTYPRLTAALLARGYSRDQLAKIAGGNLMRVWRENLQRAAAH